MFSINSKVQALDSTCSKWRNAVVIDFKNDKYIIHFENFNNKYNTVFDENFLRFPIEERIIPRNALSVRSCELANLILNDKVIVQIDNAEHEATVLINDPYLCTVTVKEFDCQKFSYENIILTNKNELEFKKKIDSTNENKKASNKLNKQSSLIDTKELEPGTAKRKSNLKHSHSAQTIDGQCPIQIHANYLGKTDKKSLPIDNNTLKVKNRLDLNKFEIEKLDEYKKQFNEKLSKVTEVNGKNLSEINCSILTVNKSLNDLTENMSRIFSNMAQLSNEFFIHFNKNFETLNRNLEKLGQNISTSHFVASSNYIEMEKESHLVESFPDLFEPMQCSLFSTENINKKEYLTDTEIQKEIQKAGSSGISFAANLLEKLFCVDELQGCNVYGKGKKDLAKRPLDVQKVEYIQNLSERLFNHSRKKDFWKNCTNHMNKRIHKLLKTEEEDKDVTL